METRRKFYQIELDEENYLLLKKQMDSYITNRNKARERQRNDTTRKQNRAIENVKFEYKMLKEYEMIEKKTLLIPEIDSE